jgi:adenosylcobinamide-phosphate synthase
MIVECSLVCKVVLNVFEPNVFVIASAVLLDLAIGDPVYRFHPIRLMGRTLNVFENLLWHLEMNGYGGGITLFFLLALIWAAIPAIALGLLEASRPKMAIGLQVFLAYSMIALHDLLRHAWRVGRAANRGDLAGARLAISQLVGRDIARMDLGACRRAAIESTSENLTDGWISPIFWYVVGGLPLLLLFKVVSTMDSMVGFKTERYFRFGWCGARMDDVMNWIPARLTWLLLSLMAFLLPNYSARQALICGWRQHAIIPGPNAGWSEATTAGALRRRLIGPIWKEGRLITDVWLGNPSDSPAETHSDLQRAGILVTMTGLVFAGLAAAVIVLIYGIHLR